MMDLAIVDQGPEKEGKRVITTPLNLKEMIADLQHLQKVNAELKKVVDGIDICHAVRRKDKTVFINAHVTQEVHDLLWKIKEARG